MKISDVVNKVMGRTPVEYFKPGALVKRRGSDKSALIGTVGNMTKGDGKLVVDVTWMAGDGVRYENIKNLVPAKHSQEFKRGDRVTVAGAVGRISALEGGDLYSVEFKDGGFEHDVPASKIKKL